jgi:hypothetical protein
MPSFLHLRYSESADGSYIFKSVESNCRNNITSYNPFDLSTHTNNYDPSADSLYLRCRKLGINYEFSKKDENICLSSKFRMQSITVLKCAFSCSGGAKGMLFSGMLICLAEF